MGSNHLGNWWIVLGPWMWHTLQLLFQFICLMEPCCLIVFAVGTFAGLRWGLFSTQTLSTAQDVQAHNYVVYG